MKNPLTYRVESTLGAVYISLLSLFFVGLIFVAIKNFETDTDIDTIMAMNSSVSIKRVSSTEIVFLKEWIIKNDIKVPEGQGYRYLVRKYPSKPWLSD